MVTLKGSSFTSPGYNYIWPIFAGKISPTPIISSIPVIYLNFGFTFLDETKAIITDFDGAYDIVNISPTTYEVTLDTKVTLPDPAGTCWSIYSHRFNTVFVAQGLSTNLTMVDPTSGAVKGHLIQNPVGVGSVDLALDRNYLYVLQLSNYISVSDLTGLNNKSGTNIILTPEVQSFELSGTRSGYTGLAVYPNY
jgi:hypothetical protein